MSPGFQWVQKQEIICRDLLSITSVYLEIVCLCTVPVNKGERKKSGILQVLISKMISDVFRNVLWKIITTVNFHFLTWRELSKQKITDIKRFSIDKVRTLLLLLKQLIDNVTLDHRPESYLYYLRDNRFKKDPRAWTWHVFICGCPKFD